MSSPAHPPLPPRARAAALSPARRRALSILHPAYPLDPQLFAHYMWPASRSWSRTHQAGRGIRLKATTFLARLARDGLARRCDGAEPDERGYVLTPTGQRAIEVGPAAEPANARAARSPRASRSSRARRTRARGRY